MPVTQTAGKTFNVSAGPAMGASSRLTTSFAWGISWGTWRSFGLTILILGELSGHWLCTGCSSWGEGRQCTAYGKPRRLRPTWKTSCSYLCVGSLRTLARRPSFRSVLVARLCRQPRADPRCSRPQTYKGTPCKSKQKLEKSFEIARR